MTHLALLILSVLVATPASATLWRVDYQSGLPVGGLDPAGALPFQLADLQSRAVVPSGYWTYDDRVPDLDPDPEYGEFVGFSDTARIVMVVDGHEATYQLDRIRYIYAVDEVNAIYQLSGTAVDPFAPDSVDETVVIEWFLEALPFTLDPEDDSIHISQNISWENGSGNSTTVVSGTSGGAEYTFHSALGTFGPPAVVAVPEPGAALLFAVGGLLVSSAIRRR